MRKILPLLIFVITFLGFGIYNDDFYALPSPIAAVLGIASAFVLFKGNINQKVDTFLKGCGDGKILTMCIIYLLAGAFASVSKAIGSVDSIVNFGMDYISPQYFPAGVFVMASFLSFASGTSVGSIVTLAPIVIGLAEKSGSPMGLIGSALLCGAMFGDNLSLISDTTIAATQSLGTAMKDKFRVNFGLALPSAVLATVIFTIVGFNQVNEIQSVGDYNLWTILPYFLVIILSLYGVNVFVTLFLGIVLAGVLGLFTNMFDFMTFAKTAYEGFTGMSEIFFLSLLTGGLAALVEKAGGITYILEKISSFIRSPKTALLGTGILVSAVNLAVANNTIAILISGKISKKLSDNYQISPKNSASVLDIFSCIVQGLIPYGAQVLILISLSNFKIKYTELLYNAYYLYILLIITLIFIIFKNNKKVIL